MRRRTPPPPAPVALSEIPTEFTRPTAAVWTDRLKHIQYLTARRWPVDVRDRFLDTCSGNLSPQSRRMRALRLWASDAGVSLPADLPDPAESGTPQLRKGR